MSAGVALLVAQVALGVPLAVAAGLVAEPLDREACAAVLGWRRPACSGVPPSLWWRLVRRSWRRGRRLRTLAALAALALHVAAGLLRCAAVAVRLADVGTERAAWSADRFADDPMLDPPARIR